MLTQWGRFAPVDFWRGCKAADPVRVLCMKILQLVVAVGVLALAVAGLPGVEGQTAADGRSALGPGLDEAAERPQLAILDTDIGDDIDDAFALALALRSPELRI